VIDEYFFEGGFLVEADNMTPSDALARRPSYPSKGTTPAKCLSPECLELTIFRICGPCEKKRDELLIEALVKRGWTTI